MKKNETVPDFDDEAAWIKLISDSSSSILHHPKPTESMQLAAVKKNPIMIDFLVKTYRILPSADVQLAALTQDPWWIEEIDNIKPEVWKNLEFKNKSIKELIRVGKKSRNAAKELLDEFSEKQCPWPEIKAIETMLNETIKPGDILAIESLTEAVVGTIVSIDDEQIILEGDVYVFDEYETLSNSLDEAIAPHGDQNNELKMMKDGTKPAALVLGYQYETLYRPLVQQMKWEVVKFNLKNSGMSYVIAQPGQRARAEKIAQLVKKANEDWAKGLPATPEYHRELGTLLGYGKEDIEDFIAKVTQKVAEGEVISGKLDTKRAQNGQDKYRFNPDIAAMIPLYDPMRRFGTRFKTQDHAHGDEVPFARFESEQTDTVGRVIGVTNDGTRVVVSTTTPELAQLLADAFNRKGFAAAEITKEPLKEDSIQKLHNLSVNLWHLTTPNDVERAMNKIDVTRLDDRLLAEYKAILAKHKDKLEKMFSNEDRIADRIGLTAMLGLSVMNWPWVDQLIKDWSRFNIDRISDHFGATIAVILINDVRTLQSYLGVDLFAERKRDLVKAAIQTLKFRAASAQYSRGDYQYKTIEQSLEALYDATKWPELKTVVDSFERLKSSVQEALSEACMLAEAKYKGREVKLGKPMPGDVKKYKVYVRNPKTGNIKKVNFGDKNMEIKRDDPKRRKNFRARHGCGTPRASDRTKAAYWSCRLWSSKNVSDILKGK